MTKHKSARCSTGHDSGVMMPSPLAQRLRHRYPSASNRRLRSRYSANDYRSIRVQRKSAEHRKGGLFVQYLYQQAQHAIAVNKAKIQAARKGTKFEMPETLQKWGAAIQHAGRVLLGKR